MQQLHAEIDEICTSSVAEQRKRMQLEDLGLGLRLVQVDLNSTEHYVREMPPPVNPNQDPHQNQTLLDDSPLPNLMLDQYLPTQWDLNQVFCPAIGWV